ncbi:hypothetical protein, partial [Devosia sp.]|uniref:hypothetical protein n=1 Tax=Devosia sp. TaxID=1871048 RepID=UPI002607380D
WARTAERPEMAATALCSAGARLRYSSSAPALLVEPVALVAPVAQPVGQGARAVSVSWSAARDPRP